MTVSDLYWPVYTASVDGVACGHVHQTPDRAENCARNMMARGHRPQATVFQRNQDGSRIIRRELTREPEPVS